MKSKRKSRKVVKSVKRPAANSRGQGLPRLTFLDGSGYEGFEHGSIAQFSGNDADSAVREFLQNSLDAAVEVNRTAKVNFTFEKMDRDDVPGILEYEKALKSAIKTSKDNRGYNQNARQIAERLSEALEQKKISVLFVVDNGAGFEFDETGFLAVLSDGLSNKENEEEAGGSFGNGHHTAFSASNLRYIFYAAAHKPRNKKDVVCGCLGHAVLATHANEKGSPMSKDGYWVKGITDPKPNAMFDKFIPVKGDEIPSFIRQKIESVKESSGTGSIVAILAFNNFGKKRGFNLSDEITRISALHFFAAVHEGKMEVSAGTNENSSVLTKRNLRSTLEKYRDKQRASVQGFPSGGVAWNAYNTLTDGEKITANTGHGKINIRLLKHELGDHSVVLCRDGMYITRVIKNLRPDEFSSKEPFNAVICLDKEAGEAYRILKATEANLHNRLDFNKMSTKNVEIFDKITKAIASAIKGKVKDQETDSWSPAGFMSIMQGENKGELKGTNIRYTSGGRVDGSGRSRSSGGGTGAGTGSGSKSVRRPGRVRISSRRLSPDKMRVIIRTEKDCDDVEFSMTVDKGRDLSCSGQLENAGWEKIKIRNIDIAGQVFKATGDSDSVNIGKIGANEKVVLDIEYEPPDIRGGYTVDFDFERQTDGEIESGSQS